MTKLKPYLYGNGGNIIMVQVRTKWQKAMYWYNSMYTSCGQNQELRTSCGHPTKRLHTSCGHSKYISNIYGIYHAILFTKVSTFSFPFYKQI
jgi:hypothetical protein